MPDGENPRGIGIHLIQWRIRPGDIQWNLTRAAGLLDQAHPKKGDLVLLPEMFSSGFYYSDLGSMADRSPEVVEWMTGEAGNRSIAIAGSIPETSGKGIINSLVFIDHNGKRLGSYAKIHLFPPTGEESQFHPGSRPVVLQWSGIRIGLLICYDLRFPELPRFLCMRGAHLLLVSAQWPKERIGQFRRLVRVRAMENQLIVAGSNSSGEDGAGFILGGRSMIAGPMGEVLGELDEGEGNLSLTVEPEAVLRIRTEFPVLSARKPGLYSEWFSSLESRFNSSKAPR